jgi:hypothetical protein
LEAEKSLWIPGISQVHEAAKLGAAPTLTAPGGGWEEMTLPQVPPQQDGPAFLTLRRRLLLRHQNSPCTDAQDTVTEQAWSGNILWFFFFFNKIL